MRQTRLTCAIAACAALLGPSAARAGDFDFWLGTWEVENRHRTPRGMLPSGTAEAFVRPVLGGAAVFEQWDGTSGRMEQMFGTSLRWEDSESGRWLVMLNWPGGSPRSPRFGVMEGVWDEQGVCRQYSRGLLDRDEAAREQAQFYSFSDITPESCRWTMHAPAPDGGHVENWIMDFSRTKVSAAPDRPLGLTEPPADCACESDAARDLDPLLGAWRGSARGAEGLDARAEARFASVARGCITAVSILVEEDGALQERWFGLLSTPGAGSDWDARLLGTELRLYEMSGPMTEGIGSFAGGGGALTLSLEDARLLISIEADGNTHAFAFERD